MTLKDILALHDAGIESDVLENFIRFSVSQNATPATTTPNVSRETLAAAAPLTVSPVFSGRQPIVPTAAQTPPNVSTVPQTQPAPPDLNQKLDALTQLIQNSNILHAQQPEPKQLTLEDVMTDIISPRAAEVN